MGGKLHNAKSSLARLMVDDDTRPRGIERRRETRAWQRDMEAGEHGQPLDTWHDNPDSDWVAEAGGYGAYDAQPEHEREPYFPYAVPHHRPLTAEKHERREAFKERVKRIREKRNRG